MATVTISQKDVEEHLQRLTKIRPPEDRPTEKQVIEMLLRMKKRWHLS
jgi:hypothetical protein